MLDITLLDEKTREGFYSTPEPLALKMAELVQRKMQEKDYRRLSILEPSAGTGSLIRAIGQRFDLRTRGEIHTIDIDYIESDENLRKITGYSFSGEYRRQLQAELKKYENQPDLESKAKAGELKAEIDIISRLDKVDCVGDDFLSYQTYKRYDLIIMNPPFAEGDRHLLKAIEMQKRTGGMIVALLNAETIRNPYTATRKELARQLAEYGAEITYIKDAFTDAERKTDVEVALIYCGIKAPELHSNIWEGLEKAREEELKAQPNYIIRQKNMTYIDTLLEQYNFEIQATMKLVEEYEGMKPYILDEVDIPYVYQYREPILKLTVGNSDFSLDGYLRMVRLKYWKALFYNKQFTGKLTSNLQSEFLHKVNEMCEYDFNEFNISRIKEKLAKEIFKSYNDTILALFDKLSCVHSYRDDPAETNVHYYNGWKTNKAWKINDSKVIIPFYGACSSSYRQEGFNADGAYALLGDIEQVLNYLDNGTTAEPAFSMLDILQANRGKDAVKNLECKYFVVTFYKKGTCHIAWKDKRLVEKLNIFGSQRKGWLPPSYGKKSYEDMTEEEKAVIDSFQGKEGYGQILAEKEYYLHSGDSFPVALLSQEDARLV